MGFSTFSAIVSILVASISLSLFILWVYGIFRGTKTGKPTPRGKILVVIMAVFPGLGHIYQGLIQRGFAILVLFLFLIWLAPHIWPVIFLIPVYWFYTIFNSLQLRDRIVRGEHVRTNFIPKDFSTGNFSLNPLLNKLRGQKEKNNWWILIGVGIALLFIKITAIALIVIGAWKFVTAQIKENKINKNLLTENNKNEDNK